MFSQSGQLTLAHTEATLRSFHARAEMGKHLARGPKWSTRRRSRSSCRPSTWTMAARSRSLAGSGMPTAAPRGTMRLPGAMPRRRRGAGRDPPADRSGRLRGRRRPVQSIKTNRGRIACGQVLIATGGRNYDVALMAGVELPHPLLSAAGHGDAAAETLAAHAGLLRLAAHLSGAVSRGEVVIGGGSDPYQLYSTVRRST